MEASIGPPATRTCELGQGRKAAATTGDVCAGMWLVEASAHLAFAACLFPLSSCVRFLYFDFADHWRMQSFIVK